MGTEAADRPTGAAGSRAPAGPGPARELTARALATGLSVGAVLAVANLYMGLKTGWWDSGHITASVLGFAILAAVSRSGPRPGVLEGNMLQSAATSAGAAPATMGLLGAIPALALLGREPPVWAVAALGLSLAVLGVFGALAVRRRLLEEERLPFPTGVATAEVLRVLHAGGADRRPTAALAAAGSGAALVTVFRDLAGLLPASSALPLRLMGTPAADYTLGVAWNPMLAGAGLLVGPRNGLSVLAGGVLAWGVVAPRLVASGAVAAPEYGALVTWLAWPGVALVLGSGLASLAGQRRALRGAFRDLTGLGRRAGDRPVRPGVALLALAAVAGAVVAVTALGMTPWQVAAALALAPPLALVCVRAAGQTDILPAGEVAQVAQVAIGGASGAAANVAGGALTAGTAAQMGVSLWSLRAGQLLGATASLQAQAMLAGSLLGAAVSVPLYALLARVHGIGSEALPAPSAVPWRAVAELVTHGAAAMPPGAAAAAAVALACGATLELAGRRLPALPSPGALGMGFLAPAMYGATLCAGALAGVAWRRLHPASAEALLPSVGAGAIAGESLAAAAGAVGVAAGLLGR